MSLCFLSDSLVDEFGDEMVGINFIGDDDKEYIDYFSLDEAYELYEELAQIFDKLGYFPTHEAYPEPDEEEFDVEELED
jgi:hypothetical protein